jgi:acyl-CoA thioesterase-1
MKSINSQKRRRQHVLALTALAACSVLPLRAQTPDANRDAAAKAASSAAGPILVIGDSLSAEYGIARGSGWVELLRGRLRDRGLQRAVVNASVSGETTAGGRARIEGLLRRQQPAFVIIELGGNDALRGLDLNATRANLLDMIRRSQQAGARVLLLGMKVPPNYGKSYSDAFERVFVDVARETNVPLVPFFLDGLADRLEYFQPDRIHPNESAQPRMMDNVWPALDRLLQSP